MLGLAVSKNTPDIGRLQFLMLYSIVDWLLEKCRHNDVMLLLCN